MHCLNTYKKANLNIWIVTTSSALIRFLNATKLQKQYTRLNLLWLPKVDRACMVTLKTSLQKCLHIAQVTVNWLSRANALAVWVWTSWSEHSIWSGNALCLMFVCGMLCSLMNNILSIQKVLLQVHPNLQVFLLL